MNKQIAIELLCRELGWEVDKATLEIGTLLYMSMVKYNEYRNFEAGNRFLESLILWLRQFDSIEEKETAYEFVKQNMIYFSEAQMDHLVGIYYHKVVMPILCNQVAELEGIKPTRRKKISNTIAFKMLRKKSIFLAMSDGARLDVFRRKNKLSHEQVIVSYEVSETKWQGIKKDLEVYIKHHGYSDNIPFYNFFLLDDFSGSGISILNKTGVKYKGKLNKFITKYLPIIDSDIKCNIFFGTYISSEYAWKNINKDLANFKEANINKCILNFEQLPSLQQLDDGVRIKDDGSPFATLLKKYYSPNIEDSITKSGGSSLIFGYSKCGLPLVLNHNCPNNSVYLLWAQTNEKEGDKRLRALFPRIARHEEGR